MMENSFKNRIRVTPYRKGYKVPNYKLTEEGLKKIKESKQKKVLNLDNNIVYNSLSEASTKLKISNSMLSMILNDKRKTSKFNITWLKE